MIRLSDVVGASGLSFYAIVAMLLFLFAFVLVLFNIYAPSRRAAHRRAALLPFDEGVSAAPAHPSEASTT
jgi:cbb3-type cytochrome oxidase subunit 3